MALASINLQVKDSGLIDAYSQQLRAAPQQTARIVADTVTRVGDSALKRLRQPGSPITYPVKWQTERQRRAFFATNGFGGGIPSRRTNRMVNAWKLTVIYDAQRLPTIALTNPVAYRKFVVGNRQQRMHMGRWYRQSTVTREVGKQLASEVETTLVRNLFAIDAAQEAGGYR